MNLSSGYKIKLACGIAINVAIVMMAIFTGYGGCINPDTMPLAGVAAMTFPLWFLLLIFILVLDLWLCRRLAIVAGIGVLATLSPFLTFFPINVPHGELTKEELSRSFTVLTYNVYDFIAVDGEYPDKTNRTLSYIIDADADIVCLQECEYLSPLPRWGVYRPQIDSIKQMYPYILIDTAGQSIFSKYPVKKMSLDIADNDVDDMAGFSIEIEGRELSVYNLHLQSIGLTVDDKELYKELTGLKTENNVHRIKSQLLAKLSAANKLRARQARQVRTYIDDDKCENVIVCGDFNDVSGCYAIREISGGEMTDAYAECAFGPTITYNTNRFYFRIDHVLYKGNFEAVKIERGDVNSSDHYPLLTTFLWTDD
ncbi:MAG: endonuclease/exonuclease/phosphatase family protein [Muribaculaceae bacterium]|nr:endonuclease/exonuclease/phosphatase family protein [Muribaculaceae bacterium]